MTTISGSLGRSGDSDEPLLVHLRFLQNISRSRGSLSLDVIFCDRKSGGTKCSAEIHAFTDPSNDAAAFITARELRPNVDTNYAYRQIRRWLVDCSAHTYCFRPSDSTLPTRVVAVAPPDCPDRPRLIFTNGRKGRYAALSYCWGTKHSNVLTTTNLDTYLHELDTEALPKTFQDAIKVTKEISIQYLWIDGLCIIQDSEEDKIRELSIMGQIYKNSTVTIVAANATNADDGFLATRPSPKKAYKIPFRCAKGRFGSMSIQNAEEVEYKEMEEPINSRAWTLQEQLLPSRLLLYASHTLQWRCSSGIKNLGDSLHHYGHREASLANLFLLHKSNAKQMSGETSWMDWMGLVSVYSQRIVSLPSDRLIALSGLAAEYSKALGRRYCAGLWNREILWQLLWQPLVHDSCTRPVAYRAPSWSWASVEGQVFYDTYLPMMYPERYRCEVISCNTILKSRSLPFGEVCGGRLKLKAVLRKAWVIPLNGKVLWLADSDLSLAAAAFEEQFRYASRFMEENQGHLGELLFSEARSYAAQGRCDIFGDPTPFLVECLPIKAGDQGCTGLLLEDAGNGTFCRVGTFTQAKKDDFHQLVQQEVVIM